HIHPLITGTGIIVHTNLGRTPLGAAAVQTPRTIAANYNELEYDLTGGARGGRAAYPAPNLANRCGADAVSLVSNCPAAPVEVLGRGVDLVTFSGDKLLGVPQAGIIAGQAKRVAALRQEPFFRALRCDKLILSALQTTVDLYLGFEPRAAAGAGVEATPAATR